MELTIYHRGRDKILGHSGPMIIGVISDSSSRPSETHHAIALIDSLLADYPAVAFLMAIEHGTAKPDAEDRRNMQAALDRYGDRLVVGYAFCGLGFWAGATQMALVSISRLAGSAVIAHRSVEATAQHIARELVGVDAEVMTALCEQLRAELHENERASSVG